MKYATVCSGVEAMSLAVNGMGWQPVFFSEIEPFPCELLKQRFPGVPNLGDMTKIEGDKYYGSVDVFAGGTPCQSFSVAGKRGGLEDGRGQLMLHFVKLAYEMQAKYVVWENVPGVFSSNKGEDFAALLSCLCGVDVTVPAKGWKNSGVVTNADGCYGVAWRVLDAQFTRVPGFDFAVPQRRRRVWLVGYLGDWRRAAEVLFVGEGLPWHFEAGERAGKEVARGVADRAGTASGFNFEMFSGDCKGIAPCLQHDRAGDTLTYCMAHGQANAEIMQDQSPTLSCNHEQPIITCASKQQSQNIGVDVAMPIMANDYKEPQVVCYENHANDSRVTDSGNLSPTITSRCGTGGGNLPLVKVEPRGVGVDGDDVGFALRANPSHSGDKGDGGMNCTMVVQPIAIQGNMVGRSANAGPGGKGYSEEGEMFTLTKTDVHAIAISDVVHGDKACNGKGWNAEGAAYTLDTMATQGVCFQRSELRLRGSLTPMDVSPTLMAGCKEGDNELNVFQPNKFNLVRRLLCVEKEKLMGFPPGWTDIRPNGKPTPDSPRYKACGNSWAVNCARWVMMRIQQSEDKYNKKGNV